MDINEVAALFHIHEKASAHGTNLSHIRDWAYKQLVGENEALKNIQPEPSEAHEPEPEQDLSPEIEQQSSTINRRL